MLSMAISGLSAKYIPPEYLINQSKFVTGLVLIFCAFFLLTIISFLLINFTAVGARDTGSQDLSESHSYPVERINWKKIVIFLLILPMVVYSLINERYIAFVIQLFAAVVLLAYDGNKKVIYFIPLLVAIGVFVVTS